MEDIEKFKIAWTKTMIDIWEEKIALLGVVRTGALYRSFKSSVSGGSGGIDIITHKFLEYGIHNDSGVGPEFARSARGGAGALFFKDPAYRAEKGLDRPSRVGPAWGGHMTSGRARSPRRWFSKKYFASVMALKERLSVILGEQFVGIFSDRLDRR